MQTTRTGYWTPQEETPPHPQGRRAVGKCDLHSPQRAPSTSTPPEGPASASDTAHASPAPEVGAPEGGGGAVTLFSPWHFASSPDSPSAAKPELLLRGPHLRLGRRSGSNSDANLGVHSLKALTARPWPRAVQREDRASAGSASRRSAWPAGKRSFGPERDPRGSEKDSITALTC